MRKIYCDNRKCMSCHSCEIACAIQHSESEDAYGAVKESVRPFHRVTVSASNFGPLPLRCHHCEDAPCIDACKTGATYRDPESDKVLIDSDKCVGCWMCVMVCPFGAVLPNEETQKAVKCDLCEGREEGPACVEACPTGALYYEDYEEFEKEYEKEKPAPLPIS